MNANEIVARDVLKGGIYEIIGEYRNKNGEKFVVYRFLEPSRTQMEEPLWRAVKRNVYVTGDELDWEIGWQWNRDQTLFQEFTLSEDEQEPLRKIVREHGTR